MGSLRTGKDHTPTGATADSKRNDSAPLPKTIPKLVALFIAWKALLLVVAYASPGLGYDTSSDLALEGHGHHRSSSWLGQSLETLLLKLTRWDAIYFTFNSARGHLHEQDWAFSWAFARFSSAVSNVFPRSLSISPVARHALASTVIAHASHLGAILVLYLLVEKTLPSQPARKRKIAFMAACLHIISPAGIFLSSPYGESSYALASFLGTYCYASALKQRYAVDKPSLFQENLWNTTAGLFFGCSAMLRGNGLLSGIPFAIDALISSYTFISTRRLSELLRISGIVLGGALTGIGFVIPQVVAYTQFCTNGNARLWCTNTFPSIYNWVQSHYWDVGLFKYWTLSNLPLFLLAAPMLLILLDTGFSALHHARAIVLAINGEETPSQRNSASHQADVKVFTHLIARLALPQLVLAGLALTSFHVQIVNRISSGYVVWYLILAIAVSDQSPELACGHKSTEHYQPFTVLGRRRREWVVRGIVIYALVQGGLYASFLPPA